MTFKGDMKGPDRNVGLTLFVTDDSMVCVFHDKQFSKPISWFEYFATGGTLQFVTADGDILCFGVPIDMKYRAAVEIASTISLIHLDPLSKKVMSGMDLPLITHRDI